MRWRNFAPPPQVSVKGITPSAVVMGDWIVDSSLKSMIPRVAKSTAEQYDVSVRQYFEFCTHAGPTPWTDPFLLHMSRAEKVLGLSCWLHWQHDRGSTIAQSWLLRPTQVL